MNTHYNYNDRKEFLFQMYNQLCSEIDRHIKVIWQTIGVLLSTFAIYALVEKNIIPTDIASAIIILVCGFSVAIVIESNYWYNRNLVMISNIERQFLLEEDQRDIQYYFTKHRPNNKYLDMMLIQIFFVVILTLIILLYHFSTRVLPNIDQPFHNFDFQRSIPYLVLGISIILLSMFHFKRRKDYNEFKFRSPGVTINAITVAPDNGKNEMNQKSPNDKVKG
jgi:hypothetical protein